MVQLGPMGRVNRVYQEDRANPFRIDIVWNESDNSHGNSYRYAGATWLTWITSWSSDHAGEAWCIAWFTLIQSTWNARWPQANECLLFHHHDLADREHQVDRLSPSVHHHPVHPTTTKLEDQIWYLFFFIFILFNVRVLDLFSCDSFVNRCRDILWSDRCLVLCFIKVTVISWNILSSRQTFPYDIVEQITYSPAVIVLLLV